MVASGAPAHYYSRGQKHVFETDFAAEEEHDAEAHSTGHGGHKERVEEADKPKRSSKRKAVA